MENLLFSGVPILKHFRVGRRRHPSIRVVNPCDFLMLSTDFAMQNSGSQVRFFQYILLISEHNEMR